MNLRTEWKLYITSENIQCKNLKTSLVLLAAAVKTLKHTKCEEKHKKRNRSYKLARGLLSAPISVLWTILYSVLFSNVLAAIFNCCWNWGLTRSTEGMWRNLKCTPLLPIANQSRAKSKGLSLQVSILRPKIIISTRMTAQKHTSCSVQGAVNGGERKLGIY